MKTKSECGMATNERIDPRIRRTRRLLQDALLALAEDRDFTEITIAEIAQQAEVNRNTFYLHYRDKEHLLASALDVLFDELTVESHAYAPTAGELHADAWLATLRHIQKHPRLFHRLLSVGGSTAFAARLRAYQEDRFLRIWADLGMAEVPGSPPPGLRAKFAAGLAQATIRWWLEEGEGIPAETVAAWSWPQFAQLWTEQTTAKATPSN
jgi:AcrR family transcriptional regulator